MKATLLLAAALAVNVNAAAIEKRQIGIIRPTSRPGNSGSPDGITAPIHNRNPQDRPPVFSIGRPTATVTFFPNNPDDRLEQCGLDAFVGHPAEASLVCSSILKGGTHTITTTYTSRDTTTTRTTVFTTTRRPVSTTPSSTPRPSSSTPRPSSSTPRPSSSTPTPSSSPRPSSSTPRPSSTTPTPPSSSSTTPTPAPTGSCGIVGYTKATAAYLFDSSGTKNNWAGCAGLCKADSKCKSFGYGEANCMLFDVPAADNTNYNPMSPYTFYDQACPAELPVRKRQLNISLGMGVPALSSACSCLIGSGAASRTVTATATVTSVRVTRIETVTQTVSLLADAP